jgi:hypothetical protein
MIKSVDLTWLLGHMLNFVQRGLVLQGSLGGHNLVLMDDRDVEAVISAATAVKPIRRRRLRHPSSTALKQVQNVPLSTEIVPNQRGNRLSAILESFSTAAVAVEKKKESDRVVWTGKKKTDSAAAAVHKSSVGVHLFSALDAIAALDESELIVSAVIADIIARVATTAGSIAEPKTEPKGEEEEEKETFTVIRLPPKTATATAAKPRRIGGGLNGSDYVNRRRGNKKKKNHWRTRNKVVEKLIIKRSRPHNIVGGGDGLSPDGDVHSSEGDVTSPDGEATSTESEVPSLERDDPLIKVMCRDLLDCLLNTLPCFNNPVVQSPPKVPKLRIKALQPPIPVQPIPEPTQEKKRRKKRKKEIRKREEEMTAPPKVPPLRIKIKGDTETRQSALPPPLGSLKIKISLPLNVKNNKKVKLGVEDVKKAVAIPFPARKSKPGPKSRQLCDPVPMTKTGNNEAVTSKPKVTKGSPVAAAVAAAAAAIMASSNDSLLRRTPTPPLPSSLFGRKSSTSPCPPDRRRRSSSSNRKEMWVFGSGSKQQQQQVMVKNPPFFAKKSRAVVAEEPSPVLSLGSSASSIGPLMSSVRPSDAPKQDQAVTGKENKSVPADVILRHTIQAIELDKLGTLSPGSKVYNMIDTLFGETFKEAEAGAEDDAKTGDRVEDVEDKKSHSEMLRHILSGVVNGAVDLSEEKQSLKSPPKKRPNEAFSRNSYAKRRKKSLMIKRRSKQDCEESVKSSDVVSNILDSLVQTAVETGKANSIASTSPPSPPSPPRKRAPKRSSSAFSRSGYVKRRRSVRRNSAEPSNDEIVAGILTGIVDKVVQDCKTPKAVAASPKKRVGSAAKRPKLGAFSRHGYVKRRRTSVRRKSAEESEVVIADSDVAKAESEVTRAESEVVVRQILDDVVWNCVKEKMERDDWDRLVSTSKSIVCMSKSNVEKSKYDVKKSNVPFRLVDAAYDDDDSESSDGSSSSCFDDDRLGYEFGNCCEHRDSTTTSECNETSQDEEAASSDLEPLLAPAASGKTSNKGSSSKATRPAFSRQDYVRRRRRKRKPPTLQIQLAKKRAGEIIKAGAIADEIAVCEFVGPAAAAGAALSTSPDMFIEDEFSPVLDKAADANIDKFDFENEKVDFGRGKRKRSAKHRSCSCDCGGKKLKKHEEEEHEKRREAAVAVAAKEADAK